MKSLSLQVGFWTIWMFDLSHSES